MAHQLSTLGVDIIEAGFPITSEADAEAVRLSRPTSRVPSLPRSRAVIRPTSTARAGR